MERDAARVPVSTPNHEEGGSTTPHLTGIQSPPEPEVSSMAMKGYIQTEQGKQVNAHRDLRRPRPGKEQGRETSRIPNGRSGAYCPKAANATGEAFRLSHAQTREWMSQTRTAMLDANFLLNLKVKGVRQLSVGYVARGVGSGL